MASSKGKRLGAGRVAFLARIEIFREKITAGHTMQMVYEEHQDQLGIGYSQFVNYINRYIRKKAVNETKPAQAKETPAPGSEKPGKPEYGQPRFKRNENRDDLINPKPKE